MIFKFQSHFFLVRLASLLGLSAILLFPMVALGYFTDEDNVADNGSFVLGAVDAAVAVDSAVQSLSDSSVTTFTLNTSDASTIATQSRLSFTPQSCQTEFYNNLLLEVTTASGTTVGTFAGTTITETDIPTVYALDVAAAANLVATTNEGCTIVATLETWQASFLEPDTGFSSVSQVSITVIASESIGAQETSTVVLNELYPAVLSTSTQPLEREWVELYNGTDSAVDVAGWRVDEFVGGDMSAASRPHTIVSSCSGVTASDHMQPFDTSDTVIAPGDFLVMEFCGSASYLSDAGDTVQLFNSVNLQVDTHTFPATANGKSHARIPDGAAWVDPVPTPGNKNSATRADLEAEGWAVDRIDETLQALAASTSPETVESSSQMPVTKDIPTASTSQASNKIGSGTVVSTSTASSSTIKTASSSVQSAMTASTSPSGSVTATTTVLNQAASTDLASTTVVANTDTKNNGAQTALIDMPPATTTKPTIAQTDIVESTLSSDPPDTSDDVPKLDSMQENIQDKVVTDDASEMQSATSSAIKTPDQASETVVTYRVDNQNSH